MAFSSLSTSIPISRATNLPKVLDELKTALHQRQSTLGGSLTSFPTVAGGVISTVGGQFITTLRAGITGLIGSGADAFVKDDLSSWSNIGEVLTAAGHSGGWDDDYRVSNGGIWTQFHDVFGVLKKYRRNIAPAASLDIDAGHGFREGNGGWTFPATQSLMDDAWAEALSDTPEEVTTVAALRWLLHKPDVIGGTPAEIVGNTARLVYDFTSCLGAGIRLRTQFRAISSQGGIPDMEITYAYGSESGDLYTLEVGLGTTTVQTFDFTTAIPAGSGLTFTFSTTPPGTTPYTIDDPAPGNFELDFRYTHLTLGSTGNYWADITSALTYG